MRVLFFYPEINVLPDMAALLDMGRCAAALRARGDEPRLAWARHLPPEAEFAALLDEARPHVFLAWIAPGQMGAAKPYLYRAKKRLPKSVIMAGGPLASLAPDDIIALPGVDALALGAGEAGPALAGFIEAWSAGRDVSALDNFWMKTAAGGVIRRALSPYDDNLDARPRPDPEFVPYAALLRGNGGLLPVRAGHGAGPMEAAALDGIYRGRSGGGASHERRRAPGEIAAEVIERFDPALVSAVQFVDEAFPAEGRWLRDFCALWRERVKLPFRVRAQAEDFSGAALELLREAGCAEIAVEIIPGLDPWRRPGAAGEFSEADLFARLAQIQSLHIPLRAVVVLGHHEADPRRAERALKTIIESDPAEISFRFFDPLPGTPAWQECRRAGLISERERFAIMPYRSTLQWPAISEEEMLAMMERLHRAASAHAANRLMRLDEAEGYFDVLLQIAGARITARNATLAGLGELTIEKQTRPALWQAPGTEAAFDVALRPSSHLCFGAALEPDWGQLPAGETFELEIELAQNGATALIFHKVMAAKDVTRWFDYALPLSDARPGPARLTFRFRTAGGAEFSPRRAFWSRPFLTDRSSLAGRGQKSATADVSQGAIAIQRTVIEKQERELEVAQQQMDELRVKAETLQRHLDRRLEENEALRRQVEAAIESITRLQAQLQEALPIVEKHNKSIAARVKKMLGK